MFNRVVHFEIHAANTEKIAKFYSDVFQWEIKKWENPNMEYWMIMTAPEGSKEPGINGGIVGRQGAAPKGGEPVTSFVSTIQVENVDEHITKVIAAGGKVTVPKMAIPGLAWLAYCTDPEGNIFGLYEENSDAE
ncbi:glyoxalase [Candidatus Peregrinibacteria bacterium CG11_big_fil_rev_8_21_14_0_20_46_8]|nr:MAG: glyoxalase [Candidatus Peregrinibacteria bacterium CG11_big_fil_rev_8_21_14_0_20_46_8]